MTTWAFRELDDERVLALDHVRGRGKTSGVDLGQMSAKGADLSHIRGAKVVRVIVYFDRQRAFADLGLTPEGETT